MAHNWFADAIAARDAKLKEVRKLRSKERNQIATVVGGVNTKTGEVAIGIKRTGESFEKCAEDLCVEALGGTAADVVLSPAVRPRTGEIIPVCKRCQTKYGREQFPQDTPFEE